VAVKCHSKWYADIRTEIVKRYGDDADLFCDLLAATSPRSHVRSNWRSASALYHCWKQSGVIAESAVFMRMHLPNVRRAFAREPLHGGKVRRFAENLKGNSSYVTIDVWICRYLGVEHKDLTPELYATLEKRLTSEAESVGMSPADYQAMIWQQTRAAWGKKPISFMAAVDDERQGEFQWT
jgi:hypothetical protein